MVKTTYYQDLTKMNTFGMKVKARCFMEYDSVADLVDIEFSELARPVLHIGGGSNLLFTDDFKGTVLHSKINFMEVLDGVETGRKKRLASQERGEMLVPPSSSFPPSCPDMSNSRNEPSESFFGQTESDVYVSVGAGVVFDDFCEWAAKEGLWGVENLSYIPGETGASAVQNIGAYGVEVKDVIHKVYCYDTVEEEFVSFSVEECGYGYRDSIFKKPEIKGRYIVTHVVFALSREPKPKLEYGHLKEAVLEALAGGQVGRKMSDACPQAGQTVGSKGRDEGKCPSRSAVCPASPHASCHVEGQLDSAFEDRRITPSLIRKVIIRIRKEKLPEPSVVGSAGSFFKNPVISLEHFRKIEAAVKAEHGVDYKVPHYDLPDGTVKVPAAWMIEQCGWKGKRSGGAAVWEKQPLVIVNYTGEAYPEEIIGLERRIIDSVKRKFGVELHPEVDHI